MHSDSELEDSDYTEDEESPSVIHGTPRRDSQRSFMWTPPLSSSTPSESGQSNGGKDDKLPINPKGDNQQSKNVFTMGFIVFNLFLYFLSLLYRYYY